jgi:ABC-2 type transport system ATP-binding protein
VLGQPITPGCRRPWERVGYLVETPHAYPELTVAENLEAARRLHPGTPPHAVTEIIERLALGEYAQRKAGHLSLGNVQRLGLAKALLHRPELLILDEPANALDPAGIVEIRQLLLELAHQNGVTIFMSSHILAEVARLAERVGIIHQGRLLQELNMDELERNRRRRVLVDTRFPDPALAALQAAGFASAQTADGRLEINDPRAIAQSETVAECLSLAGCPPRQLIVEEEDLEQYFLRLVNVV